VNPSGIDMGLRLQGITRCYRRDLKAEFNPLIQAAKTGFHPYGGEGGVANPGPIPWESISCSTDRARCGAVWTLSGLVADSEDGSPSHKLPSFRLSESHYWFSSDHLGQPYLLYPKVKPVNALKYFQKLIFRLNSTSHRKERCALIREKTEKN
jgi:hypothetical protein